jgi:adenylate cyclase
VRQRLRNRQTAFLAVGLLSAALALVAYATEAFEGIELDTVDARFAVRGTERPPPDVAVVEIDDVTLDELDERWPFKRSIHAELIDRLRGAGVRTIAYDIQFTEPTAWKQDNALIESVARADGRVVLATTEVNRRGGSNIFGGEPVLKQIGARSANTVLDPDTGGVLRRVSYEVDRMKSFAIAVGEVATGETVQRSDLPDPESGEFWVDYAGPPGTVPSYSFSRVLDGTVPASELRDRIVVIGASAPRLQDLHQTPYSKGEPMPGAEVLANAIATVQRGFPLKDSSVPLDVLLITLLGLVAPAASLRLRPLPALALALGAGAVYVLAAQVAFNSGLIVPVIYPLCALGLSATAVLAEHYVLAAFERAQVRATFARFVPESVVDDVLVRANEDLRLGGVRRLTTVLFSDLRGFTSFSERLEPDVVIEVLNTYLGSMSDAIMDEEGTLVCYMGDGIMAVFGAPLEQDDHADRALRVAREMTGPRLERFNAWLRERGLSDGGFRMGVGLNTGWVMSGNVGSERRIEYTAVGDTTNTAARLEGMTKGTPYQIFLADSTLQALKGPPGDLECFDTVEVRGRSERLKVWGVPDGYRTTRNDTDSATERLPLPSEARATSLYGPGRRRRPATRPVNPRRFCPARALWTTLPTVRPPPPRRTILNVTRAASVMRYRIVVPTALAATLGPRRAALKVLGHIITVISVGDVLSAAGPGTG